jgi:tetratricopeptide (TPR) repeat protein
LKLKLKVFFSCGQKGKFFLILMGLLLSFSIKPTPAHAFLLDDRISFSKGLAHYAMGQIYDLLGMTNNAVLEYERSLKSDTDSSYLPYLRLGANYARLNMLDEAKEALGKVNKINEDDLQSHYLLALIYSAEKDYDKAAGEYELILKKFSSAEPRNIEIYGYLAQLYYSQKKYNQAIKQFEKILELDPENADVMYLLGSLYLEVNDDHNAIEILKKSITIDPEHDGSLNTLGYLYAEIGKNLDEAEKLVARALEISPDNGAYLDSLGWVYYKKGEYEQAAETLLNADKVMKDPVIYDHLGDVYFKMNNVDEAIKYWQLSLELNPDQEHVGKKIDQAKLQKAGTQASMTN